MKAKPALLLLLLFLFSQSAIAQKDAAHSPTKGSTERQAILDALRGGNQEVMFQVHYVKVHDGWCWIDTTPSTRRVRQRRKVAQTFCILKTAPGN